MEVVTLNSALQYSNLLPIRVEPVEIAVDIPIIDGVMTLTKYFIKSNKDDRNFVKIVGNFAVPTPERAIVDYITCEKHLDEGNLIWAIQNYIDEYGEEMMDIYKVADFYGVDRDQIDFWFNEARNDDDYSMG